MGLLEDLQAAIRRRESLLQQRKNLTAALDGEIAAAERRIVELSSPAAVGQSEAPGPVAGSEPVGSPILRYLMAAIKANPELDFQKIALDLYGEDSSWARRAIQNHLFHLSKRRGLIRHTGYRTWEVLED